MTIDPVLLSGRRSNPIVQIDESNGRPRVPFFSCSYQVQRRWPQNSEPLGWRSTAAPENIPPASSSYASSLGSLSEPDHSARVCRGLCGVIVVLTL